MGGLKSAFKSVKRFVKKNSKEIATIAGLFIPGVGPAMGAAIGRGIGGLAEGEDLAEAAMAGAQIYAGGKMLGGAGFGYDPNAAIGSGRFYNAANAGVSGTGIGGFFEGVGANTAAALGANVPGAGVGGTLPGIGESFEALNFLQKGAVLGTAASGANSLSGGKLFGGDEEPATMSGPLDQSGYLTQGLTPAQLSDVYGTQGSGTGIAGSMPSLAQSYDYDPVNSTIAELLKQQDEYELEFPEFARVGMNMGGVSKPTVARLADGGTIPEIDLRDEGGDIVDENGSGDEDTVPALLADGEFVVTKQAVAGMGNGDHDQGIAQLYAMMDMNENKAQQMGIGRA